MCVQLYIPFSLAIFDKFTNFFFKQNYPLIGPQGGGTVPTLHVV
jgi:hypothetical protein